MKKQELDRLYHLLRVSSNDGATKGGPDLSSGLTPREEMEVIYGLARHLLAGGDYPALIRFSMYYGRRFLLKPTCEALLKGGYKPNRVVEFGAGLGWLGRGISASFGSAPCLFVDKRPWPLVDIVADLETDKGITKVLSSMKEGDLIVAADFLHCLGGPTVVMANFLKWPMAILEYCPISEHYRESYNMQVARYGANPVLAEELGNVFKGKTVDAVDLNPYVLLLVGLRV